MLNYYFLLKLKLNYSLSITQTIIGTVLWMTQRHATK